MQNPQAFAVRKYLFDMLKDRYPKNADYIERLASGVITKTDYESLGSLMADVYEAGFMRAVEQYKEQMAKLGMRVNVVPEAAAKKGVPIFGDQEEKSG
jgi:deoxyhypusine synthase